MRASDAVQPGLARYNDIDDIREQQPERVAVVNSDDYKAPDKMVG